MSAHASPVILIVEDEVFIRFDLADFLRERGCQVIEAGTAQEALDTIESGARVDIVFSDIQMPGEMSGIGLASYLETQRPGLPVILTSGATMKMDLEPGLVAIGPIEPKPYDPELILARILKTLARQT